MPDPIDDTREKHEISLQMMATPEFTDDLIALLKIRTPIIFFIGNEERRITTYFRHLSSAKGYKTFTWDCYQGMFDISTKQPVRCEGGPDAALEFIIKDAEDDLKNKNMLSGQGVAGKIYLLLDFHRFIDDVDVERKLKKLSQTESMTTVIIVGPSFISTPVLENLMSVVEFPLPNKDEITGVVKSVCRAVRMDITELYDDFKKDEHKIISSVSGLTLIEVQNAISKSVVKHRGFHIPTILEEKKQLIKRKGILEYFDPKCTINDIGGLQRMINWFKKRQLSFSPGATEYGIPPLKGVLIMGTPGSGKSLAAKSFASLNNIPLLKLDFGSLFKSHVGESEQAAKSSIDMAEHLAPCCLWIDEVEKGISGLESSGRSDGGTTSRVISTFLTWMQEKTSSVVIVCTSNDINKLPIEFTRAGRFDEIFFVGFPTFTERKQIYTVLLKRYKRNPKDFDLDILANKSKDYTGAEIEKSITKSLFEGFADKKREITTDDIVKALSEFTPQYLMRKEYFDEMLKCAKERGFVMASEEEKDIIPSEPFIKL